MLTESGFFKEADAGRISRSSVPPDLAPGRRIADKYELLRKVGTGAMGEVWAAKHLSLDEEVAIKLVLRDIHHEDGSTADGRFLVEARVARMLSRKTRHIVSVTDHGDDGDLAYLVMELLNGEPLDTRLARSGPLPVEKVLPVVQQVARALEVAHAEGIVHRDLKPGNVFLTLDEEGKPLIKILDFGIAKLRDDDGSRDSDTEKETVGVTARDAQQVTMKGFLLGTPAYMSPEQARGKAIDHRADVWALGVITFHLLTAQFPFDGKDAEELFERLVRVKPFPITDYRTDLPDAFVDLFARAFSKRIDERFASAAELATALEDAAGNRKPTLIPAAPPKSEPKLVPISKDPPSEIIAAGVPRENRRGAIVAGVVVLALFGVVAIGWSRWTSGVHGAAGLAAGATTDATAVTTLTRSEDIPAVEPTPPAAVNAAAPPTSDTEQMPPSTTEPAPSAVAVPVPSASITPLPPPLKQIDKSEVF